MMITILCNTLGTYLNPEITVFWQTAGSSESIVANKLPLCICNTYAQRGVYATPWPQCPSVCHKRFFGTDAVVGLIFQWQLRCPLASNFLSPPLQRKK